MTSPERFVTRHLWSGTGDRDLGVIARRQRDQHQRAQTVVRAYYGASLLVVALSMRRWEDLLESEAISPQWPAAWARSLDVGLAVGLVVTAYAVSSLVAALVPESRWARGAAALALLQYAAIENGFGKVNHDTHAWLYVALVLVVLPHGHERWAGRTVVRRHRFLTVVWAAQLVVLVSYGLTGFWKVAWATVDLFTARISAFEPRGFAFVAANRLSLESDLPLLGEHLVENVWLGWPAYLATMYVETGSFVVAFRPRLHRLWGVMLVTFHFGTQLGLGFSFGPAILLLGLLLVASPLAPDAPGWRSVLGDLPGIFIVRRAWARRRM